MPNHGVNQHALFGLSSQTSRRGNRDISSLHTDQHLILFGMMLTTCGGQSSSIWLSPLAAPGQEPEVPMPAGISMRSGVQATLLINQVNNVTIRGITADRLAQQLAHLRVVIILDRGNQFLDTQLQHIPC